MDKKAQAVRTRDEQRARSGEVAEDEKNLSKSIAEQTVTRRNSDSQDRSNQDSGPVVTP